MRNRINRVGIELEGGWLKLPPNTRLAHDGSVFRSGQPTIEVDGRRVAPAVVGELPSPPMPPGKVMEAWMRTFYPTHVDQTCGLHVHMSFRNALHYQLLMEKSYTDHIIAGLTKWGEDKALNRAHPLWPRLRGENEYCVPRFWGDQQVKQRSKSYNHSEGGRYSFINYCHGLHSTLECRGLPMFADVDTAISAVNEVLSLTNAFILMKAKRQTKHSSIINIDEVGGEALITYHDSL
jgi:hypothetical protein